MKKKIISIDNLMSGQIIEIYGEKSFLHWVDKENKKISYTTLEDPHTHCIKEVSLGEKFVIIK